jgi:hypothetical protein
MEEQVAEHTREQREANQVEIQKESGSKKKD